MLCPRGLNDSLEAVPWVPRQIQDYLTTLLFRRTNSRPSAWLWFQGAEKAGPATWHILENGSQHEGRGREVRCTHDSQQNSCRHCVHPQLAKPTHPGLASSAKLQLCTSNISPVDSSRPVGAEAVNCSQCGPSSFLSARVPQDCAS